MTLQLNNAGAWKNLFQFPDRNLQEVKEFAAALMECADVSPKLRITAEDITVVLYYERPSGWTRPKWAAR